MIDRMSPDAGPLGQDASDHDRWADLLVGALESGKALDLSPRGLGSDAIDAIEGAEWPSDRQVPASTIREVLLRDDVTPSDSGLTIRGGAIAGSLDLADRSINARLTFEGCYFSGVFVLSGAVMRSLILYRSYLPGMELDKASLTGIFEISHCEIGGSVRAVGAKFSRGAYIANTELDLLYAPNSIFEAELQMENSHFRGTGGHSIDLQHAVIGSRLDLSGAQCDGEVSLMLAKVEGSLVTLHSQLKVPLDLSEVKIKTLEDGKIAHRGGNARAKRSSTTTTSPRSISSPSGQIRAPDDELMALVKSSRLRFAFALIAAQATGFVVAITIALGIVLPILALSSPSVGWALDTGSPIALLSFAALAGFLAMSAVETLKRLSPLRGAVQFMLSQRWLRQHMVGLDDRIRIAELLAGGRNARNKTKIIASWGFTSAHNLPAEQLVGQIGEAVQGSKSIRRALGRESDASLDSLAIYLSGSWRTIIQGLSWAISGLVSVLIVQTRVGPQLLSGWLLGGVLSWFFRDLIASIERFRT